MSLRIIPIAIYVVLMFFAWHILKTSPFYLVGSGVVGGILLVAKF